MGWGAGEGRRDLEVPRSWTGWVCWPPLRTCAVGSLDACPFGLPVPKHHQLGPKAQLHMGPQWKPEPTLAASEVRSLWAWMVSQPLPTSTLIAAFMELQLSAEWGLGWGRGGSCLGRRSPLSWLPLAGLGMAGLRVAPGPQDDHVPGPAARLPFEMSPVGGTLVSCRYSGLCVYLICI